MADSTSKKPTGKLSAKAVVGLALGIIPVLILTVLLGVTQGWFSGVNTPLIAAGAGLLALAVAWAQGGLSAMKDKPLVTKVLFYVISGALVVYGFGVLLIGNDRTWAMLTTGRSKLQTAADDILNGVNFGQNLDILTIIPVAIVALGVAIIFWPSKGDD